MKDIELNKFVAEINKFSIGKFLLYESKLSNFLTSLSENETLYDLIERCLRGFNFESEFKACNSSGVFVLPKEPEKIIAIVFCILVEVDEKKIDFYKFVSGNYPGEEINESYKKFMEEAIIPFKNSVIVLCCGGDEEKPRDPTWGELMAPKFVPIETFINENESCQMAKPIVSLIKGALKSDNKELFKSLVYALIFVTKNKKFIKLCRQFFSENC